MFIEKEVKWDELLDWQKEMARNQYLTIRANEDEISEEYASKIYSTDDNKMREMTYWINPNEPDELFVNI